MFDFVHVIVVLSVVVVVVVLCVFVLQFELEMFVIEIGCLMTNQAGSKALQLQTYCVCESRSSPCLDRT